MIEAWLMLPALALAYLAGASGGWGARLSRVAGAGVLTGAVSLSWMAFVSIWPAAHRPYADGSSGNSIFSQVFVYNGFGRLDQASPNQLLTRAIGLRLGSAAPSWHRLLSGAVGRDTAWLIPAALISLVVCLIASRDRNPLLRAGTILWGTWLVVLLVVFSVSSTINVYYTAALSVPIAGLVGGGLGLAWERRANPRARQIVAATVAVTCAYAVWLLPSSGEGLVAGLPEAAAVIAVAAIIALLIPARASARTGAVALAGVALAGVALLVVPAVASVSVVAKRFGPFDTPFETTDASALARALGDVGARTEALLPILENTSRGQPDLMATQTSAVAAPFIYDSGEEVLPIGGYTGTIPEPSLAALKSMIARGDFHLVIQAPTVTDPRLMWVAGHCFKLNSATGPSTAAGGLRFDTYFCGRPPGL
jgi:hypothetical protein